MIDSLVSAPEFYDRQYAGSDIQSVGDNYVGPGGPAQETGAHESEQSYLQVFLDTEMLAPRYDNGSCLETVELGTCICRYIFLSRDEASVVRDELETRWAGDISRDVANLRGIFDTAKAAQKPVIFYGQD